MRLNSLFTLTLGVTGAFGQLHGRDIRPIKPLPPEHGLDLLPPTPIVLYDLLAPRHRARATTTSDIPAAAAPPTSPPSPAPTPLDLSISYSLSDSCLVYLTSILQSPNFLSCLPFSLLLTSSSSYTSLVNKALSTADYTTLNTLLAYVSSPQPSSDQCDSFAADVFKKIGNKGNCQADLGTKTTKPNVIANEAKVGFGNYQVMRQAAGLIDEDTGSYCYLEALANDKPDDLYLWQLPAGIGLPSSSTPSCSKCSGLLLNHLALSSAALNQTLIQSAANVVNSACGTTFVAYSARSQSAAATNRIEWSSMILGLSIFLTLRTFV